MLWLLAQSQHGILTVLDSGQHSAVLIRRPLEAPHMHTHQRMVRTRLVPHNKHHTVHTPPLLPLRYPPRICRHFPQRSHLATHTYRADTTDISVRPVERSRLCPLQRDRSLHPRKPCSTLQVSRMMQQRMQSVQDKRGTWLALSAEAASYDALSTMGFLPVVNVCAAG